MKALRIHQFGGAEQVVWEDIDDPCEPQCNEVKVRVKAGALNHLDLWVREGLPGVPVDLPMIQGCDMAGEVEQCGQAVKHLKAGDRVLLQPGYGCGLCHWCLQGLIHYCQHYGIYGETCDGNFCEYVIRGEQNLFKVPENLSWSQAAALPLVSLTVWEMLMVKAQLKNYETLLILGASSGIGSMAIQIGRHLKSKVIAITSGPTNVDNAYELGADHVIDRLKQESFSKEVKQITKGKGVDVVFEHTGQATFDQSFRSLGRGGRLVVCGGTTGPQLNVDVRHVFSKQWKIFGSTMGPAYSFNEILPLFEKGILKPVVGKEMEMSDGAQAQRELYNGSVFGKIVLMV